MSCFVVNYCELRACQHWRIDNKCTKNNMSIAKSLKYVINMHDGKICQVRKQFDQYRLKNLLEEWYGKNVGVWIKKYKSKDNW